MGKNHVIIKNVSIGFISQFLTAILQFVTRIIFLHYFGVKLLGISSTFLSVLDTLSLAELGFQTAIVYSLYIPISLKDEKKINDIMNVLRVIYKTVGVFFILLAFCFMPFVQYVLKGVDVTSYVYLIFILHMMSSACTYFFAYKRTLLYADQKVYIVKLIDFICFAIFSCIKIGVIILLQNYILYLCIQVIQMVTSNIILQYMCSKIYPYLHKDKFNTAIFKSIFSDVKNVFVGKIANYVFFSTNNILVSMFVSTATVGLLNNYTIIVYNIKAVIASALGTIAPSIGNMLAREQGPEARDNSGKSEKTFLLYTHIRTIIAAFIIIPVYLFISDFIGLCFGSKYIMSNRIVLLIALDLYINFVYGPCNDYIVGKGLFKQDKKIQIIGAVINIVASLILVQIIGVQGVLLGTVIGLTYLWLHRSYLVYKECFAFNKGAFMKYWRINVVQALVFLLSLILSKLFYEGVQINLLVVRFFVTFIFCSSVYLLIHHFIFHSNEEYRYIQEFVKNTTKKYYRKLMITE